jgi:hypothetical protein
VVPPAVRRQAGLKSGQEIEFKVSGGVISIRPKLPTADGEYTPEQRRIIDARLAKADADIKAGRVSKAFSDPSELSPTSRLKPPSSPRRKPDARRNEPEADFPFHALLLCHPRRHLHPARHHAPPEIMVQRFKRQHLENAGMSNVRQARPQAMKSSNKNAGAEAPATQ